MKESARRDPVSASLKSLIFCVHAHQPVGNFDHVFEEAFQKSYHPFFEVLKNHRSIRIAAHFSGSLLDWIEKHHPEFIADLKKIYENGQLEFLGGGYYEPIYGMIPKKDLEGQILLMRKRLREFFGAEFSGAWLTERVWDAELISVLSHAGIEFTILDDTHFAKAGVAEPVLGYYHTQKGKSRVDFFSSSKQLRYLIPFRRAEETLDWLRQTQAGPGDVFTFADDCEKFGFWPGTFEWVYKEKWLDNFWTLIENDPSVRLVTFEDFRRLHASKGRVDIDHASYSEMMEWSEGRFYNFFKKYPESGYMKNRMLSVSRKAQKFSEALPYLYRAQCNCSYWHGVFGGLYLHHLRSSVFKNLIEAEKIIEKKEGIFPETIGADKYFKILQKNLNSLYKPASGGAMEELDFLPKSVNLMCNLSRQKERYHAVALSGPSPEAQNAGTEPLSIHEILGSKEKDLAKHLFYDKAKRASFLDHFFDEEISPESFGQCTYHDIGDFYLKRYTARIQKTAYGAELVLGCRGSIEVQGQKIPISIEKIIYPKGGSMLNVAYRIKNLGERTASFVFGVELNISIGEPEGMRGIDQTDIKERVFNDSWHGIPIRLSADSNMRLSAVPIETVSESEAGLERTFQTLGILCQKKVTLKPKKDFEMVFELGAG